MTLTDVATIIGSISTTVAVVLYVLVEFPRIRANFKVINSIVDKETARFVKTVRCVTVFAFFGSIVMFMLLTLMILDPSVSTGPLYYSLWVVAAVELIFWVPRAKKVFP